MVKAHAVRAPKPPPKQVDVGRELKALLGYETGKTAFTGWVENYLNDPNATEGFVWDTKRKDASGNPNNMTFNWSKDGGATIAKGGPTVRVSVDPKNKTLTIVRREANGKEASGEAKIQECNEEAINLAIAVAMNRMSGTAKSWKP